MSCSLSVDQYMHQNVFTTINGSNQSHCSCKAEQNKIHALLKPWAFYESCHIHHHPQSDESSGWTWYSRLWPWFIEPGSVWRWCSSNLKMLTIQIKAGRDKQNSDDAEGAGPHGQLALTAAKREYIMEKWGSCMGRFLMSLSVQQQKPSESTVLLEN